MTPEELARFASDVRLFSPEDIDRLHRVLFRLQEASVDFTPAAIEREYKSICLESHVSTQYDDPCLQWLLDLLETDPEIPLNEKFLDVLQEANIVLTTDGTSTEAATDYEEDYKGRVDNDVSIPVRPVTPDSIDSINENDPLWQQAVALDNRKLASQALEQWRHKLQLQRAAYLEYEDPAMNAVADSLYLRNLARKVLSHWRNTVAEIRQMDNVADDFRMRRDAAFSLKNWTLATREMLFVKVRDEKILRKTLEKWQEKTASVKQMEAAAADFRDRQALQNVLVKMVAKRSQIRQAESQAVLVYEGNLSRKTLHTWVVQLDHIRLNERRAEAAADYFASKHILQKWREKARFRIEERKALEARKHVLSFTYFHKWRAATRKSKEAKYTEAYKTMRRRVKMNIARTALIVWREKATQMRQMDVTAQEFRARKDVESARRTAHGAIITMFNKAEQVQEANLQADAFFRKNLIERLHIFGSNWLVPTRQVLENQRRADEYRSTRTASYAVQMLRNWRNAAFRTKRLEEDADVLFHRNEKRRALGFLQKWRQASAGSNSEEAVREVSLVPATPAARRNQLLASTTPAYTPAVGLFGRNDDAVEEEE
ncbi:uncharacterized protein Z520_04481 [Fonsecaea multimorphosa CBS 102226]|uniref:Sfi1 spindle body domain-containing protein n=1 Tax=Fonsecaea multimorphosa CBS 102226 TaxID=1442371 RepID=A0A0D2HD86_9EURO|nr:uncharacterized protein Z520_04481 [Fonsecaea multimorphosa CBS 102226]KIX99845.1 hypothetical protein Z520_04481 [Fonsecaea multimorphosa CBS 102226]OAL26324.1 hypothetical protein AYO22_04242 [Fonsecaea multimorphosa]